MGLVMEAWSRIPRSDYTIMNENFGFTELSANRFQTASMASDPLCSCALPWTASCWWPGSAF